MLMLDCEVEAERVVYIWPLEWIENESRRIYNSVRSISNQALIGNPKIMFNASNEVLSQISKLAFSPSVRITRAWDCSAFILIGVVFSRDIES